MSSLDSSSLRRSARAATVASHLSLQQKGQDALSSSFSAEDELNTSQQSVSWKFNMRALASVHPTSWEEIISKTNTFFQQKIHENLLQENNGSNDMLLNEEKELTGSAKKGRRKSLSASNTAATSSSSSSSSSSTLSLVDILSSLNSSPSVVTLWSSDLSDDEAEHIRSSYLLDEEVWEQWIVLLRQWSTLEPSSTHSANGQVAHLSILGVQAFWILLADLNISFKTLALFVYSFIKGKDQFSLLASQLYLTLLRLSPAGTSNTPQIFHGMILRASCNTLKQWARRIIGKKNEQADNAPSHHNTQKI